jgi:hypothetical protein
MRWNYGWVLLVVGCAPPVPPSQPVTQVPLDSGYSSGSGSGESYSAAGYDVSTKGLSPPTPGRLDATVLIVRPDLFSFGFAVREAGSTPAQALSAAKAQSEAITTELGHVIGPAAIVTPKGLGLTARVRNEEVLHYAASINGVVEVRLQEQQDFWARTRLYAVIVQATEAIEARARARGDELRGVNFDAPRALIAQPEEYRAELLERWVNRVKEFATAAEAEHARLHVRDCSPPSAIQQTQVSFDEVGLSLPVDCRVDTLGVLRSDTPAPADRRPDERER